MNPRIEKLKAERDKTANRIEVLQSRLKALDEQILKLENLDIIGIVRENGLSIDRLVELVDRLEQKPTAEIPTHFDETEDTIEDEE